MSFELTTISAQDGTNLAIYHWSCNQPKAIVQIIHGMSEYGQRYDHFATELANHNFLVYASDLRGHGKTAGKIENIGYFAQKDGWQKVVNDVAEVNAHIKTLHSELPIYVLGHSMGSFVARSLFHQVPNCCKGLILSGTAGNPGIKGHIGKVIAQLTSKISGGRKKSILLNKMSAIGFNSRIKNPLTIKDWLTRDQNIVEKYINDDYCNQLFYNQFFIDLVSALIAINRKRFFKESNIDTPILLIAGMEDPVGEYGKGPRKVAKAYSDTGVKNVTLSLFKGARHEVLNEINKEEVYATVIDWIKKDLSK
ncbi:MAG TPA: alpha/beta fold hydrolase [Crocinitomicaceae bacterium]|nr:alpha/beta fold hydrolase [Crocinitomicaceae bacterium]